MSIEAMGNASRRVAVLVITNSSTFRRDRQQNSCMYTLHPKIVNLQPTISISRSRNHHTMPPSVDSSPDMELGTHNLTTQTSTDRNSIDENYEDSPDQPFLVAPDEDSWHPPPGFAWIQTAIMTNVFLNGFDYTITATTYATISSEFDAANTASWLTTSYLITATAFQPLYGRVSDIFGRRICFFTSTVTFAAGCLGCGIAKNIIFLNVMRALTGFGGGGLMTMGMSHLMAVSAVSASQC